MARWGDNVAKRIQRGGQRAQCHVQGAGCGFDPCNDALLFPCLRDVIEGEDCRFRVLSVRKPNPGSSPCVQVMAHPHQGMRWPCASPKQC